jgi:microcephalin
MQLAALVRTEAAPSTRAGTRKKSRLGGMGDASQLEKCTTVARPKSAPAVVGGVSAGDAEPVDLFSPLRPSAALQRALREAATARAQPEEEAEEKQQSAVVVIEEASPARVPLAPIAPSDVNLIPEPAVMLELPPACDEDDALPAADVAVVEQDPPVLAFIPRGMLAVTCASPELSDVVAAAAKQLRMRLCPFASATVTHLVLGEPKRTLKVLHAIARGAWLLTPAWVYASVEAGQRQKEDTFEDETFPGARKSRVAHRDAAFKGLLGAMKLAVHEPRRTGPPASELRALAIAAGATLVKKGPCNVVIVASGDKTGATAAGIAHKGATIVTEQWMMDALAAYELPSKTQDYQP